jgi:hypothetical protein
MAQDNSRRTDGSSVFNVFCQVRATGKASQSWVGVAGMRSCDTAASHKDMGMETEDYPLLGAVTSQWLVKTEDFVCCSTVIGRVCRSVRLL